MKKLISLALLIIISIGAYAQDDPIKRATTITNIMTNLAKI